MIKKVQDKIDEDKKLENLLDSMLYGLNFNDDKKDDELSLKVLISILELKKIYDRNNNLRVSQYLENLKHEIKKYSRKDFFYIEDVELLEILNKIKEDCERSR